MNLDRYYNTNGCRLSVLVCSLTKRHDQEHTTPVIRKLREQIVSQSAELLVAVDDGEMSVGNKRNFLMEAARGDYVVYVDDDDDVADDYVVAIVKATEGDPDCIGIRVRFMLQGKHEADVLQGRTYAITRTGSVWTHPINHCCPVRRSIAQQVRFRTCTSARTMLGLRSYGTF